MTNFQSRALGVLPLDSTKLETMHACANDMTRERLIEVVRQLALSHERLWADYQGMEILYAELRDKTCQKIS